MNTPAKELLPCPNGCDTDRVKPILYVSRWAIACHGCGMAGPSADTASLAATRWNSLPRSNPVPVADLTLRDAIRLAIAEDDPDKYPSPPIDCPTIHITYGLTDEAIDRCADIAYATVVNQLPAHVAAPEVAGAGLDRERPNDIVDKLVHAVKATKESFGEVKVGTWSDGSPCALKHTFSFVEIVKQANALDQGDFDAPAPHPIGEGVAAVKSAWTEYERICSNGIMYQISSAMEPVRKAIEALHKDSDSARLIWTKELPTKPGLYLRRDRYDARRWFPIVLWTWDNETILRNRENGIPLSDYGRDYDWAGPYPEPQEPAQER